MNTALVDAETIATFQRDGVACIRGLLDPEQIEQAKVAIQFVLDNPSPLAQEASSKDDPGSFIEDFCRWNEVPAIEGLALHSRAPEIAAALMGSPSVRLYHDHVLVKSGGTHQRTPWHQDQPYYNVDGRGISAWIPMDPVPESGCLELVAGTHQGQWLMPRTFLDGEAKWFPEGALAELPDIETNRAAFDIVAYDMQPGDAIFFDFLTVHGAPGFPFPGQQRRVLSLRYLSESARHAPRHWRTSPEFEGLVDELAAGAVMDHPLFPIAWPPSPPR